MAEQRYSKRKTIHKALHVIECPECKKYLASASERNLLPSWSMCDCLTISYDKFSEEYKPQINHIERAIQPDTVKDEDICSFDGCMYEIYGEEYQYISDLKLKHNSGKRIWTIIESGDDFFLTAGMHHVNRYGYIITEKEWSTGEEEIKFE